MIIETLLIPRELTNYRPMHGREVVTVYINLLSSLTVDKNQMDPGVATSQSCCSMQKNCMQSAEQCFVLLTISLHRWSDPDETFSGGSKLHPDSKCRQ